MPRKRITIFQWDLVAERQLSLTTTKIVIDYVGGPCPYHVHREGACHGAAQRLEDAKELCKDVVRDLLEMGVDP